MSQEEQEDIQKEIENQEEQKETNEKARKKKGMILQLGDIIEIRSPSNHLLHENTFFIDYIDELRLVLIDIASLEQTQLNRDPDTGFFTDQSIKEIHLMSRADQPGYARQNRLIPGTWIELHISGDVSTIITGEITGLEEDQIEITTVPELDVIFIDFEYKGIPTYIPIKKIVIRDKPSAYSSIDTLGSLEEENIPKPSDRQEPRMEYLETGEAIIHAEEDAEEEDDIIANLRIEVSKSKQVVFGEDLETIEQTIELPENQRRYGIDLQTASMLDELLSTIPATKRSQNIMNKIHTLISRYRELRQNFSLFDDSGDVQRFKRNNPQLHKPIVNRLKDQDLKIDWILPVTSIKKKVYVSPENKEEESNSDIIPFIFDDVIQEEENIKKNTYYNDRTLADESKYFKIYQQLADLMKPFENPPDHPEYLSKKAVQASLEAIISNYDEFNSSVIHQENVIKRRYVIQKYDLGLPKRQIVRRGDHEVIETSTLTAPDEIYVNSIVVLPAPVVTWSRVRLPETSILEKSNLHHFSFVLFRILQKNREIAPFIIDDLEKDIYQHDGEKEEESDFLKTMRHYILSDTLKRTDVDFDKFLQSMIPKTKTLIHLVRKYITQKLSFVSVVQALEPFQIYSKDISYKQYLEIRRFIIEQIENKKTHLETKRKDFGLLALHKFNPDNYHISILQYLIERPELIDQLIDGYQLPSRELLNKFYYTSEILLRINATDNGVLLSLLLQHLLSALRIPTSLANILEDQPIDDMNKDEKRIATDCHRQVLAKKYKSTAELQKDNGKEIFFDKEYDETPYFLLDNYKEEQKKMASDLFQRFLIENLVKKHNLDTEKAEEIARYIIRGKKPVEDGVFAVVVLIPELEEDPELSIEERRKLHDAAKQHTKNVYYQRKSDVWVHHRDIEDEAFIDTKDLFCNVKKECMVNPTNDCVSLNEIDMKIRQAEHKKIKDEFDTRFELSAEDAKATLHTKIIEQLRYLQRWIRIQAVQKERFNNMAYQIGLEATQYTDIVTSPHLELRDRIISQTDFIKKQNDILRLYDKYCREPMEILSEDLGWKYCRMSNTKLLPAFLYELASAYVRGGDYALKLEEICHTHGLLSDSGDAIVDKHSGLAIRAIDFAEEDGYDESGFKLTTHAFIQKGEVDKAVENLMDLYQNQTEKQVCEGERAQMICQILGGLAAQIGHSLVDIRDTCVQYAIHLCDQSIDTEEKYAKEAKKAEEKKGIKLPPYKKRSQQLILLITTTIFFMTIQTEIPSFQTNKVMPGCVKSFKGFPLAGEEDTSGLLYMACVLSKMEKKVEPWNAIEKMTVTMIQEQLKKIATIALKNGEIDERYLKKREFLVINEIDDIPQEHSVQRWSHFLPPLIQYAIQSTVLSADFKDEFISAMKKGSKHQHADFFALQSKIAQLGFSIISAIQKIVKDKELLLSAASTGTPFLQNVCCNEKERIPILYFAEEEPEILRYVRSAKVFGLLSRMTIAISKPAFLFDPRGRSWDYPPISSEINETNIYAAFIHFCKLNKGTAVPAKFHVFFTDIPIGFPAKTSLDEQIAFLKQHDKRFSKPQFIELLQIVHRENIIEKTDPEPYHRSEILKDLISLFDNHESPVIDADLREHIRQVLEKYDKTKLVAMLENDDNDEKPLPEPEKQKIAALRALKNNLAETIEEKFRPAVLAFLRKNGKLGQREFDRLIEFFNTFVTKWSGSNLYQVANFIKNTIYEMTCVFPNMLITNITNVSRLHKYWGLADVDAKRVYKSISAYYEPLGEFRNDPVLIRLLTYIQPKFTDLRLFFQHLPIQEAIQVGGRDYYSFFDKETVNLLLEYVFLSVLHEYIIATDKIDLIRMDQVEIKKTNRAKIAENREPKIVSEYEELDDDHAQVYADMMEIQIEAGDRDALKIRVAKMLLSFINIVRKNKSEVDISYDNISAAIRKRKEKEKNRIVERFKNMSEDERKVEDMKKKYKMDEWNVGTQRGIFEYNKQTSTREVSEQQAEEALEIQKHGIKTADFVAIHADTEEGEEPLREMLEVDQMIEEGEEDNMVTGLADLKHNFFDGQFYSDDESDDDFGDNE
jgi:hypothetical protein